MTRAAYQLMRAEAEADDRRITSEAELQRAVAAILDRLGLLWCHVPNGSIRDKKTAALLQREGVKAGVPDVLIFDHTTIAESGCAIELKHGRGRLSEEQGEWASRLASRDWYWVCCYTVCEVLNVLESCGYLAVDA